MERFSDWAVPGPKRVIYGMAVGLDTPRLILSDENAVKGFLKAKGAVNIIKVFIVS